MMRNVVFIAVAGLALAADGLAAQDSSPAATAPVPVLVEAAPTSPDSGGRNFSAPAVQPGWGGEPSLPTLLHRDALAGGRLNTFAGGSPGTLAGAPPASPTAVRWYHGLAALGVIALTTTTDEPIHEYTQDNRTDTKDDVAYVFRQLGEPEVYLPVALAPIAVGLVTGKKEITRAGGRIAMSILTAGVTTNILKNVTGRSRPNSTDDAYQFSPFSGNQSWPSGHTAVAFAMATSVGDEIGSLPVSIALYTAAGLTGWSRINDNKHWFSDVLTGAAIGVTSAKLMNGRWKVFGIGQPRFLASPKGVAVGLSW